MTTEYGSECVLHDGTTNNAGYGLVYSEGRQHMAHRYAYTQANGPIPPGVIIRHTCHVRLCVEPSHLVPGTYGDNMADKIAAGRHHNQRKGACPRGHRLEAPNLVAALANRGTRNCKSCHQARRMKDYHGWTEDQFVADADRRYAELGLG